MRLLCSLFLILSILGFQVKALEPSLRDSLKSALTLYNTQLKSGKLLEAAESLSNILKSNFTLEDNDRIGLNNNLGILLKNLGRYEDAMKYYDNAENIYFNGNLSDPSLIINIYGNKINIFTVKGEYKKTLEYIEKEIRIVKNSSLSELVKQQFYASFYLTNGIAYDHLNEIDLALDSYNKSLNIKKKHHFTGISSVYLNMAKFYAGLDKRELADKYFRESLKYYEIEDKNIQTKKVNILLEYGRFLNATKRGQLALIPIKEALNINLKISGEKNQLTSNCYQLIGDFYLSVKDYIKALSFYQKGLVSGSNNFSDLSLESNPHPSSWTINLWQLRILRRKAEVLSKIAELEKSNSKKVNFYKMSLATQNLAIEMTSLIRSDYQDEETRLEFSDKQKSIYTKAIEIALKINDLTGDKSYLETACLFSQQYKANELKYEIAHNISLTSQVIPDSLVLKEKEINKDIASYNILISREKGFSIPDTAKIAYWKDQIFELKRNLEKTLELLGNKYSKYVYKTNINVQSISTIQANLNKGESIVDYVLSEKDSINSKKIYEFVITSNSVNCHVEYIDSTLSRQLNLLKNRITNNFDKKSNLENYNITNLMMYKAYSVLIKPIKPYFSGNELIILPDEEISYFPFDAFLTSYDHKSVINYAELPYLIFDYSISYGYSINTLWAKKKYKGSTPEVFGFAPDYTHLQVEGSASNTDLLTANKKEIGQVLSFFKGTVYKDGNASLKNFRSVLNRGGILHLAMHSEVDIKNPGTSSLLFTPEIDGQSEYRLYNYEIGQMDIYSPLVILSACNTGAGKYYNGEGAMSIARNFVLSGVPSVLETFWPVEDIASSKIMKNFYKYLSAGKTKKYALRKAKLDYIETNSPSFVNPGFWAAFALIGDTTPVINKAWNLNYLIICGLCSAIVILIISILVYRLRLLKIS